SLPAGHQQVEPHRTSILFAHRHELARDTARESRHDRQLDRSTHSRSGLRVRSEVDRGRYPGGVNRTDAGLQKRERSTLAVRGGTPRYYGSVNREGRQSLRYEHMAVTAFAGAKKRASDQFYTVESFCLI